ncbi:MAG: hypothetical protein Q9207_004926 [Kuettlingeria erythrocarpa]
MSIHSVSLRTLFALGSLASILSPHATAATRDDVVSRVDDHPTTIGRPGATTTQWYNLSTIADTSPLRLSPAIVGIGLSTSEWSSQLVPDRNFRDTALFILGDIYNTRPNASEMLTAPYVYTIDQRPFISNITAMNISAVGRGREAGLPITFDNAALVMFMQFLGLMAPGVDGPGSERRAYAWCKFQCQFAWKQEGEQVAHAWVVAEGNFTALPKVPFAPSLKLDVE